MLDETLTVAAQQPCVLEAGSACQATFIAQYEREQHAYLMYVTGLREKRSSASVPDRLVRTSQVPATSRPAAAAFRAWTFPIDPQPTIPILKDMWQLQG